MYELSIEDTFDAAHRIPDYHGNCRNVHGHTYKVAAVFRFKELGECDMAIDFKIVKSILKTVLEYFDHKYINELPEFKILNPTAENLAAFIYNKIKLEIKQISSVSIWETPTSCAKYYEDE